MPALDPAIRRTVYIVSAVVALLIGGTQVFYTASGYVQPQWVIGALALLAFVQTFISGMAAKNTVQGDPR